MERQKTIGTRVNCLFSPKRAINQNVEKSRISTKQSCATVKEGGTAKELEKGKDRRLIGQYEPVARRNKYTTGTTQNNPPALRAQLAL